MPLMAFVPPPAGPALNDWRACALFARDLLSRAGLAPAEHQGAVQLWAAIDRLLGAEAVPPAWQQPAPASPSPWQQAAPASPSPWQQPAAPAPVVQFPTPATVFTWGENDKGALGQGFQRPPNWEPARAVSTPDGKGAVAVAAGSGSSGFLTGDGGCHLAGTNASYLHGDTQARGRDVPTQVPLLAGRRVTRLFLCGSSTHAFACVDGRLHAWGRYTVALGLGRSSVTVEPTPVELLGPTRHQGGIPEELVRHVAVGAGHSWLLLASGELWGAGSNSRGQLGSGMRNNPYELDKLTRPDDVGAVRFVAAACGQLHSACVSADGGLYVAGCNEQGQLGLPTKEDRYRLTRVERGSTGGAQVVAVACGAECTYCLTADGRVHATGTNAFGQLGLGGLSGSFELTSVPLPDGRRAVQLAAGERHAMVLCEDGSLVAWGDNYLGQVTPGAKGEPVREPKLIPAPGPGRVVAVAVGRAHNVVLVA